MFKRLKKRWPIKLPSLVFRKSIQSQLTPTAPTTSATSSQPAVTQPTATTPTLVKKEPTSPDLAVSIRSPPKATTQPASAPVEQELISPDPITGPPRFPPEIERIIFELAVRNYHVSMSRLMCVAKRVKIWIVPILQETIVIWYERKYCPSFVNGKLPNSQLVRHLFLRDRASSTTAWHCVTSCSNILTLAFLLSSLQYGPDRLPIFSQLTHLDFFGMSPGRYIEWISSLPALTHLFILGEMRAINHFVPVVFDRCPKLQVVLWSSWNFRNDMASPEPEVVTLTEPRVVLCDSSLRGLTAHFIARAMGRRSGWEVAEDIIKRRLESGTIDYSEIVDFYRSKSSVLSTF